MGGRTRCLFDDQVSSYVCVLEADRWNAWLDHGWIDDGGQVVCVGTWLFRRSR